jgi:cytidylate kinase
MHKLIIAIDGYSGCGKSTTAKLLAAKLGYVYIDTGAMYRATTLYFLEHYINLTNPKAVLDAINQIQIQFHFNEKTQASDTYLNGLNVESEIRSMRVSDKVSDVSAIAEVRKHMVALQRKMGKKKGVVMDGRDIGTKVFPDADLKFFMKADVMIRATRRQQELFEKKQIVDLEDIIENLTKRDLIDTTRKEDPLVQAYDAIAIDTSYITIEEQVDCLMNYTVSKLIEHSMTTESI